MGVPQPVVSIEWSTHFVLSDYLARSNHSKELDMCHQYERHHSDLLLIINSCLDCFQGEH